MDEIQNRLAQIAGTAEEQFLLASNQGNNSAVVVRDLPPYTLEQLQQMQAAAIVQARRGSAMRSVAT